MASGLGGFFIGGFADGDNFHRDLARAQEPRLAHEAHHAFAVHDFGDELEDGVVRGAGEFGAAEKEG
jgi:hypothetical protein